MTKIYRIAKAELSLMFYSPIAWLVIIIFTFQSGLVFIDRLRGFMIDSEALGNSVALLYGGLSRGIFSYGLLGFIQRVQGTLFLYIPLLTMGLMSRETSSGSIKLLLSSPVRIFHIILGKFGAMMIYCLLFMIVILLYILAGGVAIKSMDLGLTFSGLIGTYLLICAYSAIGLFLSSITSYQVIAAVGTLAVFASLDYISNVGQNLALVRTITNVISLDRQTSNFNDGLVSTADIIYFFIIIGLFLSLTSMRLNNARELRPWFIKVWRYIVLICVCLGIGYISNGTEFVRFYDMTFAKSQTLTYNSLAVIKQLKQPLKVTAYANLLDNHVFLGLPEQRNADHNYWLHYTRFMPKMQFEYVYYYDTSRYFIFSMKPNSGLPMNRLADQIADAYGYNINMFLSPLQIKNKIDLTSEEHRFVRQLESGDQKTFLRVFNDPNFGGQPYENGIISMMKRLVVTPPKLIFINGHGERSITSEEPEQYRFVAASPGIRESLINQGFDVDTASLENNILPKGTTTLVISDPKSAYSEMEQLKFGAYLNEGTNMLILADTDSRKFLSPFLEKLGISITDGKLVKYNKNLAPDNIEAEISDSVSNYFDKEKLIPISTGKFEKLNLIGSVGLNYESGKGFKIQPIALTDTTTTWNKKRSLGSKEDSVVYRPELGDTRRPTPVVLAVTRELKGRQQRIIVAGDADFMSNRHTRDETDPFIIEIFKWLNYGDFPVDTHRELYDLDFRIKKTDIPIFRFIFLGLIPVSFLIYASFLLIRRKRA